MPELDEIASGFRDEIGLDDFRRRILVLAIAASLIAPFGVMLEFSHPGHTEDWVAIVGLALYSVGGLAFLVGRLGTAAGGSALVGGLLAIATGGLWIGPLSWAIHLTPLLVVFAGAFTGLLGSLVAAASLTVDLLLVHRFGGPIAVESLNVILALAWANVLVAWLASEPTRLALRWSWSEFQRAEREADRARRQQGELAQLVKSLNVAQDRLEQVNRELERARLAADEARRLKAEFAATISHELRTPLNLIIGFSEMLAAGADGYGEPALPVTCQRDVDTIYRNARHLSSLIDDILDLSQIDAARMGLLRERASLADITREAVCAVEPLFRRKGLDLVVSVPEDLPSLIVDRTRVRQILINLLNNAARFTDAGEVRIDAWLDSQEVVVAVADAGTGISPEDLPRVFEEFRQVEGTAGQRSGGSGLGLTISKRLVELHGGSMWAESQPGEGSTFYFKLPICENVVSVPFRREWETWARPGQAGAREKMVVVYDEDAAAARLLQRYLDGYQVAAASSIAEVRSLRETSPVSAVMLTGPTEREMWRRARQIRGELGDVPVVVCPLPGRHDLARDLGISDYLVKPILREQLSSVLRQNGRLVRDVLIVDDDPDLVDLLGRMIRSAGRRIKVRGAYGGAEGLAAMRARRPDLVLLDLLMPDVDGYAVLEAMRAEDGLRDVPVVVVTARGNEEEVVTAGMLGITRGIGLSVAELTRVLKASLEELSGRATSNDPAPQAGLPA